jgi:hypothetical protein
MNNASAILRTLVVYAICVPLAIWLGYLLTSLTEFNSSSTFIEAGLFLLALSLPLLLRWHYILLVLCINLTVTIFFLPGQPPVWMPVLVLSLGISILQRALSKDMRFISAPQLTRPLICLMVVVLVTAKLTGGIGLRSMGGDVMGGKRYFFLLGGILTYFALTARRIPPNRAILYIALFFLPQCSYAIGDLVAVLPPSFNFLFWFFPANNYILTEAQTGAASFRFGGVATTAAGILPFMLAMYGVRGIFMSGKPWRILVFFCTGVLVLFGGFRSALLSCALIFFIQFYLEGLHRTRLLPKIAFAGVFALVLLIPFADKLPYEAQRTLSFLPLNIDPLAKMDAEGSSTWRVEMWKAVLPQVPDHLLLGKGYVISQLDYDSMTGGGFQVISAGDRGSAIAGDYHSGPLTLILTFGIWGVIAFLWFLIAALRALHDNYRYGDQSLQTINALLLAMFLTHVLMFFFVFGSFQNDMLSFAAVMGLSVSLNGGIRRRAVAETPAPTTPAPALSRPRLQADFQR